MSNLTKALREYNWGAPAESKGKADEVKAALASAGKTISATYEQPYVRHAPIGPFVAVADVRGDGSTTVWTHSAQSQGLRARIAFMLGVPVEKVVVRWLEHSGQYGRTTLGGDGAEGDAVILSQLTGKPVRVQWTMQEDMAWSTVSPGMGIRYKGRFRREWPFDAPCTAPFIRRTSSTRGLSARLLAGMPCSTSKPGNWIATEWHYEKIQKAGRGIRNAEPCERNRPAVGCAGTSCARRGSGSRISRWRH